MKFSKWTARVAAGLIVGSAVVMMGAGENGETELEMETVLPPLQVEPRVRDLAAAAEKLVLHREEERRTRAIRKAADHYGITRDLAATIHDIAVEEGIDPKLAYGLVWVESRFQPTAVSSAGAVGLAQLMPSTARGIAPGISDTELFEPEQNLRLGMRYLRHLLDRYDGDRRLALTAYNRGPGTIAKVRAAGDEPYNGYAGMVLNNRLPERQHLKGALDRIGVSLGD